MVDVVDKSSISDEEERRAAGASTGRVSVFATLAVVLCVFVAPASIRPKALAKLAFETQTLAQVDTLAPDYVFIGNSMLHTRIDTTVMEKALGRNCCFVLWTAGAESAWMHQALKNVALAVAHRPKAVFLFFRDTYLTQPSYRATDRYWWRIERLSHEDEPQLMRAMRESRTWQETLEYRLSQAYPVQKARDRVSNIVSWMAGEMVTPGRVPFRASAGEKYDVLFDLDKLRAGDAADTEFGEEDLSQFDFTGRLDASLLPSMIDLAKARGVELVFVRVQRRPTPFGPPPQRPELRAYIGHLRDYVEGRGAKFYDFTGDPELTLDHYNDGDHIRGQWRAQSTQLFLERLAPILQQLKTAP